MPDRTKQIIKLCARLSVTLVLLVWVFTRVDLDQFLQTARTTRWQYLIGLWMATAAFFWTQSMAMQRALSKQGCPVSLVRLFGASSITALYSLALPGFLSVGVKWYILKKHTGKGSHVLSSMLYNQVMLSAVMTAIGLVGLIVTNPVRVFLPEARRPWLFPALCAVALTLLVSMFVLLLNARTGGVMTRGLTALLKPLPRAVQDKGRTILTQLAVFQTAGLRFHLIVVGLNVLNGALIGLLIYLSAARAAHVTVGFGILIWLCAVVYVLGKLPISVANLGIREVTLVGLLGAYGVERPYALLMSMILFSSLLFMAALGAVFQLLWAAKGQSATVAREQEVEEATSSSSGR